MDGLLVCTICRHQRQQQNVLHCHFDVPFSHSSRFLLAASFHIHTRLFFHIFNGILALLSLHVVYVSQKVSANRVYTGVYNHCAQSVLCWRLWNNCFESILLHFGNVFGLCVFVYARVLFLVVPLINLNCSNKPHGIEFVHQEQSLVICAQVKSARA